MQITKINGSNQDILKSITRSGFVNEDVYNIPTLLGLIDKLAVFSTMCEVFHTEKTGKFSMNEYSLGDSYLEQCLRYKDQVCRAIALKSMSCYIKDPLDSIKLSGKVVTSSKGTYKLSLNYRIDGFVG